MAWCTVSEAEAITGSSPTETNLSRAEEVIFLYTNVTVEASANLNFRDLRLLRNAVAYQAAWELRQPDLYGVTDVSSYSQDGESFVPANADALLLAPFARKCVEQLSWMRSRTVTPNRTRSRSFHLESSDDQHAWYPL